MATFSEPPRPFNSISSVTMAAAVFVQRFDDLMAEIDAHRLTEGESLRLKQYQAAAEVITRAMTAPKSPHA